MNILCSRDSEEIGHGGGWGKGDKPPAAKRASFLNCGQHLPSENTGLGATYKSPGFLCEPPEV